VAYPGNFFRGVGGSTNSDEDRENGVWGAVVNLQTSEPRILIRLLRMYFPRNWEFGSAFSKHRNFGEGVSTPPPPRYATADKHDTHSSLSQRHTIQPDLTNSTIARQSILTVSELLPDVG
jgi:hypothetical protein